MVKRLALTATATALIALSQFAASQEVAAAGFMVRENSAEGLATAFAGNGSRADEASTVFNNPAGMMNLKNDEVQAGAAVVFPSIKFTGGANVFGTAIPGNNGGNAGQFTGIPHLYGVFTLNDRLKAGIAITAPFGNAVNYDPNWYGRYVGIKTAVLSVDINPNVAFQVNDWLSIGGGVSAQYFKLEFSSAIAQFLILAPSVPDATFLFKGDDWAYGFNFGALAEPIEGTRIGLTYRSKIDHNLKGPLDFTGASPLLGLVNGPASAAFNLPATIGFSITRDLDSSWSVSSDVQFNQWSSFKQVQIISANAPLANTENYKDSWMISLGATYVANDRMTWRGGIGWDQTPVTAQFRAVGLPDTDRYIIGVGLGYRLDDSNSVDGGYAHYFTSEQAHITGSANATDPVTHAVALDGKYNSGLDYLAISYRHKF